MRFRKAYIEITNCCNLNCAFCPGTKRAPGFMTTEAFRRIAAELRPYTEYFYFHLMGEPLLHPELGTLLEEASALWARVILTTNGTLLAERLPLLLTARALHKINISLQSIEANGGLDETDCGAMLDAAAKLADGGLLVNIRLWNEDGAHAEGLRSKNDALLRLLAERFPQPWNAARDGTRLAERVYLQSGTVFLWPSLTAEDYGERRSCYGLRDQLGVLCDGTVVPCCLDHDGELALGNLLEEPLAEILEKPRTAAIREGFRQGRAVEPLCRRCEFSTRFSNDRR